MTNNGEFHVLLKYEICNSMILWLKANYLINFEQIAIVCTVLYLCIQYAKPWPHSNTYGRLQ